MDYFVHLFFLLFVALVCLFIRKGFFRKHPVFLLYLSFNLAHDTFFLYIGPALGFNYNLPWYYAMSCLVIDGDHLLKIALTFALYHHMLRRFLRLRNLLDLLLTMAVVFISIGFFLRYNPSGSFLYNTTIYFGKWSFLLLALGCTLILLILRVSGLRVEKSFRFIVLGFWFYSLLQALNFFYLNLAPDRLSRFWQVLYQTGFFIPILFWLRAALLPAKDENPHVRPNAELFHEEIITAMHQFDDLAGKALRRRTPL